MSKKDILGYRQIVLHSSSSIDSFMTGTDSPVSIDSSTIHDPLSNNISHGIGLSSLLLPTTQHNVHHNSQVILLAGIAPLFQRLNIVIESLVLAFIVKKN